MVVGAVSFFMDGYIDMTTTGFRFFSFNGRMRILHLSAMAFFLTFVVWFNHAPLMASIKEAFGLTDAQVKALLILNVAITIPARILIGIIVDRIGPRRTYSALMVISSGLCFFFAIADSFERLAFARFLLGFVGAGFVVGIRMLAEWFPAKQVGLAEGLYGGIGNFGSAGASLLLPTAALLFGGEHGWRYAVAASGLVLLLYAFVFFRYARDTPEGSTYFRPGKSGGLEVTSKGDLLFYLLLNLPLYLALGIIAWRLQGLGMLSGTSVMIIDAMLVAVFVFQTHRIWRINAHVFDGPVPAIHRYKFKQVAILSVAYLVTFGAEVATVSMLPLYFKDTFGVSQVQAGLFASAFPIMCLVARPLGGYFSDRYGRKRTLITMLAGLAACFFVMSRVDAQWSMVVAALITAACAFFVLGGAGSVFAVVPLIKRRLTGQIAGMAGAYGNVGSVLFLTVLSFVSPQIFFTVIAASAVVCIGIVSWLDEPRGTMAEVHPDGTVQMIEVS
jgi:NNP family nitrate/nitrite transporter-like MFS transporter